MRILILVLLCIASVASSQTLPVPPHAAITSDNTLAVLPDGSRLAIPKGTRIEAISYTYALDSRTLCIHVVPNPFRDGFEDAESCQ